MITVYTCILGAFDNLRAPDPIDPYARYVCFSDEPIHCPPWEIQPAYLPYQDGHRNSRIPKILQHLHIGGDYSIWHDGCLQMHIAPSEAVERWLSGCDIAMFQHPCRRSVYEEAQFCARESIGNGSAMTEQVERYRAAGLPQDSGLWAGGVILRRHTEELKRFNETWWTEFISGCPRDQIALPYAAWKAGVKIGTIPGNVLENRDWEFHFHGGDGFAHLKDNPRFDAARKARNERMGALAQLCR